ncbi:MAG: DUF1800 domain-containing protein [Actinobacteria bacterium]|nr:DUF1800 domain-containing protein [Actinomycetota bacterium]
MSDPTDISHLLRRTEFGARPERVAALSSGTLEAAVDDVLNVSLNGVTTLPAYLQTEDKVEPYRQYQHAYHWWLDRMVDRPRPFQERMALFWHGHFTSALHGIVYRTDLMMQQNQLYRTLALDNYRDLAQRMAVEPAMLVYLSNWVNVRSAPNKNFARELMELFLLGAGNYSEADVDAASRAWTGHTVDAQARYVFDPSTHDDGLKLFFGKTRNWNGPDIIDEILRDNVGTRAIAARFIVRKLWEQFAHPGPPAGVVDVLADQLVANQLDLAPTLRAMFLRPEFYAPAAKHGLVRTPTEFIVAALYHLGASAEDVAAEWRAAPMGQVLFNPPNVSGWRSNSYWITTSALSGRAQLAAAESYRPCVGNDFDGINAMSPPDAVDHVAQRFGVHPLSPPSRRALIDGLQAGRDAQDWYATVNLLTATMLTPEFNAA